MKAFINRPLVAAAVSLAAGIYAASLGLLPGIAAPVVLLIAALTSAILPRRTPARDVTSIALVFLAAGAMLWTLRLAGPQGDALSRYSLSQPGTWYRLEGVVRQPGLFLSSKGYNRFVLDVTDVWADGSKPDVEGRILVRWNDPPFPVYAGERVQVVGFLTHALGPVNHGVRSIEDHYRAGGIFSALTINGNAVTKQRAAFRGPAYWASRLRVWEGGILERYVPKKALPLVLAVWLGDRSLISRHAYHEFTASGTAHMLAVSGVHAGIVYASVGFLLRILLKSRRLRAILTMAAVFLFALIAGARISSLRAAVMLALYLTADLFDREPDAPTALSLSGMIFLILNPNNLFEVGFLMSFASVASILLFAHPLRERFQRAPWWFQGILAVTLAVQLLPLPLAAHFFHVLPLAAPLANLIVVPLLTLVLWLCFITVVCATVFPPAALIFGHALSPIVFLIRFIAAGVANVPGSYVSVVSPSWPAMFFYWAAVAALGFVLWRGARWRAWAGAALACGFLAWLCWRPGSLAATVDFLDVGHSDAAFVRTPGGDTLLIDGGVANDYHDMGEDVVAPFLLTHGEDRLDYVIASHPEEDHMGGLFYIVRRMPVGCVLLNAEPSGRKLEQDFLALCEQHRVPVMRLARGDRLPLRGADLEVLHPPRGWRAGEINDTSLVVRITWPGLSLLFPGDVEREAEEMIIRTDCRADVLKAPHHGSITSSHDAFLDAVQPSHVVISTAETSRLKAADPRVLTRFTSRQIEVLRTDYLGGLQLREQDGLWRFYGARPARGYNLEPRP